MMRFPCPFLVMLCMLGFVVARRGRDDSMVFMEDAVDEANIAKTQGTCCCQQVACPSRMVNNQKLYQYNIHGDKYCCTVENTHGTCSNPPAIVNHITSKKLCTCQWDVMQQGPGGLIVKYSDIGQGALGTCYFLSSIAAIAKSQPQIIGNMFLDRDLWYGANPVFRIKFLVNGIPTVVAVDDMIPVNPQTGQPFFVTHNNGHHFWPIIMEKAWAKLFGSYHDVEGGNPIEVFKAILQCPVTDYPKNMMTEQKDIFWRTMSEATNEKLPIVAITAQAKFGLGSGHAYMVVGAQVNRESLKMVHVYNPWGFNFYNGALSAFKENDGSFWMLFEEYIDCFEGTTIGHMNANYENTAITASTQPVKSVAGRVTFMMSDNLPFSLRLVWPNKRTFKVPGAGGTCETSPGDLSVTKMNMVATGPTRKQVQGMLTGNSLFLPFEEGAIGMYTLDFSVEFAAGNFIVALNAYASQKVQFDVQTQTLMQTVDPTPASPCFSSLPRLATLDNWQQITQGQGDQLFPPEESSIAAPQANCGDRAQNIFESCAKFNHWNHMQSTVC